MGSAFQIPLMVNQPTFGTDPKSAAERLSLQHMAGQIAINKQIQQENALKVQAQQEDQNDQGTIQQAFHDNIGPDGTVDYDKVRAAVAPKIRLRNLQALEKDHNDLVTGTVKMDADKRAKLLAQNTAIGNELVGVLQAPPDQQAPSWQGSRQRLIQLGYIAPDDPDFPEQPPDAATIKAIAAKHGYAAQIQKLASDAALEESRKATAAKAQSTADRLDAEEAAKQTQRKMEDAARDHLAVTDQTSHDEWLSNLDSDIARRMPKKFDPDKTPEQVQNMALTAEQRAQNAAKKTTAQIEAQRAAVAGGKWGLLHLMHDPTQTQEVRDAAKASYEEGTKQEEKGLTANQRQIQADKDRANLEKERDRFDNLSKQAKDQWATTQKYDDAVNNAAKIAKVPLSDFTNNTTMMVKDPDTGSDIPVSKLLDRAKKARSEAEGLDASRKEILRQNQWGEFAPGAPQASSPSAAPTAAGAAPVGGAPKTWTVGGKNFVEGETKMLKGKPVIIRGINPQTGQIMYDPAPVK